MERIKRITANDFRHSRVNRSPGIQAGFPPQFTPLDSRCRGNDKRDGNDPDFLVIRRTLRMAERTKNLRSFATLRVTQDDRGGRVTQDDKNKDCSQ